MNTRVVIWKTLIVVLLLSGVTLAGCCTVAKNGATLSGKVSEGIGKIQADNEKTVHG